MIRPLHNWQSGPTDRLCILRALDVSDPLSSISGLLTSWKTPWIVPNSVLKKRLDLLRLFLATDSAPRERKEDVPDHNPSQTTNRRSLFADVRGEVVLSQATREERALERTNISASGPFLRLIMMLKKKLLFFQTKNGKQKDFFWTAAGATQYYEEHWGTSLRQTGTCIIDKDSVMALCCWLGQGGHHLLHFQPLWWIIS